MEDKNKNLIYSVDKVKLEILKVMDYDIEQLTYSLGLEPHCTNSYESNALQKCAQNYQLGSGEGSIYVGINPNWEKRDNKSLHNVILEWNPNKINIANYPYLMFLFNYEESLSYMTPIVDNKKGLCRPFIYKVMSVDMAVDIPFNYNSVVMQKRDLREYEACLGHREIETRYLGVFGENGHIKLYNKKLERSKSKMNKDKIIEQNLMEKGYVRNTSSTKVQEGWQDWTRFEITLKGTKLIELDESSFKEFCKLPNMYLKNFYQEGFFDEKLNDFQLLALEHVLEHPEALNNISVYRTRKKMENWLCKALSPLDLDYSVMLSVYNQFFARLIKLSDKDYLIPFYKLYKLI